MQESLHYIEISEKRINLSGVNEIISFNDSSFEADTKRGILQITGENLKMEKSAVESGEVIISGILISLYYPDERPEKKSRFKGIFG